jgi:hypothetical protein
MTKVELRSMPRKIRTGYVLMHNDAEHDPHTPPQTNGFQAWTEMKPVPEGWVKCACGWAGLPHYRKGTNDDLRIRPGEH